MPRDAVPDAAILRVDAEDAPLARLLVGFPAGRVDAGREGILGHEIEMVVVLRPVHVPHLKLQFQGRSGALQHHRTVAGQRPASVVRTAPDTTAPKHLVDAEAGLAARLVEAGAAGRLERVDGQVRVLSFAGLDEIGGANKNVKRTVFVATPDRFHPKRWKTLLCRSQRTARPMDFLLFVLRRSSDHVSHVFHLAGRDVSPCDAGRPADRPHMRHNNSIARETRSISLGRPHVTHVQDRPGSDPSASIA